jgi:hypothetical protein
MRNSRTTTSALLLLFLVGGVASAADGRTFETDILADTFGFGPQTKRAVDLADLHQGCPARDCIPSIDNPVFVAADAAGFLSDDDIVLAIEHGGEARAYPARILNLHEIVNDTIGADPVAITFCPLCGSGLAFRRVVDGEVTELGVSGVLYNSDLVFYDRNTGTLWDQVEGKGIVGPMTGATLDTRRIRPQRSYRVPGRRHRRAPAPEVCRVRRIHRRPLCGLQRAVAGGRGRVRGPSR